jgi:hypothetical protein
MEFEKYSFDELMYLDTMVLETIDEIAIDLFEIEESAVREICEIPHDDRVLEQLNMPRISDLMHMPCEG